MPVQGRGERLVAEADLTQTESSETDNKVVITGAGPDARFDAPSQALQARQVAVGGPDGDATPLTGTNEQTQQAALQPEAAPEVDLRVELVRTLGNDDAMAQRMIAALRESELDLSNFSARTIESWSTEAWSALATLAAGKVRDVTFPLGMRELPLGISKFNNLRSIALPGFNGPKIEMPPGSAETHIDAWASPLTKVLVDRGYRNGKSVRHNLFNHLYFRRSPHLDGEAPAQSHFKTVAANLNGAARFSIPNGQQIVCRHLGISWLRERIRHLSAQSAAGGPERFSYIKFSTAEAISAQITAADEALYETIRSRAPENHLVLADHWPRFLRMQLEGMREGQNLHFVLCTTNHAMGLELRCKRGEPGQKKYVINFYDPNQTMTHSRMVLNDPAQLNGRKIETWLSTNQINDYFDKASAVLLVSRVDAATFTPQFGVAESPRRVDILGDGRPTPPLIHLLIAGGFPQELEANMNAWFNPTEKGLRPSSAELVKALGAESLFACTALRFAMDRAQGRIVQFIVQTILEADLPEAEKIELLAARIGGQPVQLPLARADIVVAYRQPFSLASEAQFSGASRREAGRLIGFGLPDPSDAADHKGSTVGDQQEGWEEPVGKTRGG